MKLKLFILSTLVALTSSCNSLDGIKGEGPVKTKTIENLADFNSIQISRGLTVILKNGSINSATIEANENLLKTIKVTVENNVLTVTADKNIHSATKKNVFITYKSIESLNIDSGCYVSNRGVIKNKNLRLSVHSGAHAKLNTVSDHLDCEVHSGSKLDIEGFTNTLKMQSHSGSSIEAENLKSKKAIADAHSGSSIKMYTSETFKGTAHSGASIRYAGNPTDVSKSANSGGNVSAL